jgi:threonine dehydratase
LKELYEIISPRFVTELSYRYHDKSEARLYVSFEITESSETAEIIEKLNDKGYVATDFSNNEVAKTHARYLVVC